MTEKKTAFEAMLSQYRPSSFGVGIKISVRPEDRRYSKRLTHDGRLVFHRHHDPIPFGLTFVDLLIAAGVRARKAMEDAMEDSLRMRLWPR